MSGGESILERLGGALTALGERFPFLSKVLLLASGTVAGQAILVAALPILTRLYSVEEMGILGIAMTAATIAATPACLRLELVIAVPRTTTAAAQLLAAGIIAATAIFALLMLLVLSASEASAELLGSAAIQPFLPLVVLAGWLLAIYSALQFWSIRRGRIREASTTQLSRAIGSAAIQIGLGFVGAAAFGLVFGFFGYCVIGVLGLAYAFWRNDRGLLARVNWTRIKWALWSNRSYIGYSVPHSLLNAIALTGPIIVIANLAGAAEAGWLVLAMRVTAIPIGFIGSSLSRIYLTDAARKHERGQLGAFTFEVMRNLAKIGLPLFFAIMVLSPFAFPIAFGEEWARSGYMVALLCPGLLLQFIVSPVSTAFVVCKKMDVAFWLQLFGMAISLGAMFATAWLMPDRIVEGLAAGLLAFYAVYLITLIGIVRGAGRSPDGAEHG